MFVVLVGPDRAGKTTIAKHLKEKFTFDVHFKGTAPSNPVEAEELLWKVLLQKLQNMDKRWICDRLYYPDDAVYRPVIDNVRSDLIEDQEAGILRVLKLVKAYFLYITAEPLTLRERWEKLGDDPYVTLEQTEEIRKNYDMLFNDGFPLPFTKINTSFYQQEDACDKAWRDVLYFYTVNPDWRGGRIWGEDK